VRLAYCYFCIIFPVCLNVYYISTIFLPRHCCVLVTQLDKTSLRRVTEHQARFQREFKNGYIEPYIYDYTVFRLQDSVTSDGREVNPDWRYGLVCCFMRSV
jgi:hypothetical protein